MPRRRCVGCGRIAPKSELLRIAATHDDGGRSRRAVIDLAGTLPGRGAYLCKAGVAETTSSPAGIAETTSNPAGVAETTPNSECLRLAERRRGIARALRRPVTLDPELVESVNR